MDYNQFEIEYWKNTFRFLVAVNNANNTRSDLTYFKCMCAVATVFSIHVNSDFTQALLSPNYWGQHHSKKRYYFDDYLRMATLLVEINWSFES